jgi:hypothetical protein
LGGFTFFVGKNEDGKSLTIDALVKMLFGASAGNFPRINRVSYSPEGYLLLRSGENVRKLPEEGTLTDLTGITPLECSNIFIIRNSDLSIIDQGDFFTSLSERLTGIRIGELRRIKQALLARAQVTPIWTFRDVKGQKLKSRMESAEELLSRTDELIAEVENSGYDELALGLVDTEEELERCQEEIAELEHAGKRKAYLKGTEALANIRGQTSALHDLKRFSGEQLEQWRNLERDVASYGQQKEKVESRLREQAEHALVVKERILKLESKLGILQ